MRAFQAQDKSSILLPRTKIRYSELYSYFFLILIKT